MHRTPALRFGSRDVKSCAVQLALTCVAMLAGCAHLAPAEWTGFDLLRDQKPAAPRLLGDVPIRDDTEYAQFVRWGAEWFRYTTFGNERVNTDVIGLMQATVEVPCGDPAKPRCYEPHSVLEYFARALDKLDGVDGNLFQGNGGPDGTGYTSDLVIEFPPGTKLTGLDVPERVHTGLDVEAGSILPIGIVAVPAPPEDQALPYLVDLRDPNSDAPPNKVRLGLTCALCHYSLDVDWDGHADLRSAQYGHVTPGSRFKPEDAWAIGNQDLNTGWLFAMTANPILGFTVLSGPAGMHDREASMRWVQWVRDNYARSPQAVKKEVVRGMVTHARGYSDISNNAIYDDVQYPTLFTHGGWPYNYDGSLVNAGDRNSSVWTTALDFTGLIGLAADRASAIQLPWETRSVYALLDSNVLVDLMVFDSPAAHYDAARARALKQDILGLSDGIPGMLRPDSAVVVDGAPTGMLPESVLAQARAKGLVRKPESFGSDGAERGGVTALVGVRIRTPPEIARAIGLPALQKAHPGLNAEELVNDSVSLMLDSLRPPKDTSALVMRSSALWHKGYEVFKQSGCDYCHRGPFLTDNLIHRISLQPHQETGLPEPPSTAGFWIQRHGRGPEIGTQADRVLHSRPLRMYVSPNYDPTTGKAASAGGPIDGLVGSKSAGFKTMPLRYLWGSAPYLHDGGVAVSLRANSAPAGDDLRALLSRPARDKSYGMGAVLSAWLRNPEQIQRANAALSLQALVLADERARVIAGNHLRMIPAPHSDARTDALGLPVAELLSAHSLGISGQGHEFWVDDEPGGERVTALVAFLLALDHFPLAASTPTAPITGSP